MKKYILIILLASIASIGFAQSNYQHVVFLKNDSIVKGVIIELVPDKFLKIETPDRTILVYQMAEIEKLIKEETRDTSSLKASNDFKAGFMTVIEVGHQSRMGSSGKNRVKLDFAYGYQLKPYLYLGLGTGFRYYYDYDGFWGPNSVISLFPYLRTNLKNQSNITPYFSTGFGYSFGYTTNNERRSFNTIGMFFNPAVGIEFPIFNKTAMNIGLGYEMQKFDYHLPSRVIPRNLRAYGINLGISF